MENTMKRRAEDGELEVAPRKKQAGSARTGQACDRCKIRKIRCDARPGGCSPCAQNNTECRTRDRITGRATVRGQAEAMENENAMLKMHVVELQQQLKENQIEPRATPAPPPGYVPAQPQYWQPSEEQQAAWGATMNPSNGFPQPGTAQMSTPHQNERHGSQGSILPEFRQGLIGDNYLGVSSGNSWLSPIEGTSLTLFGMKIDLAEFLPDEDPNLSPMSYKNFIMNATGGQQMQAPQLPEFEQCRTYARWWFRDCCGFVPVVHKADFMDLLSRIYGGQYQPTTAESVMVHMMLTVMNFQYASRNGNSQAFEDAMSHYHYSLTLVPQLMMGHTLPDLQALSLICTQLRSQPRVGAAYTFISTVLGIAVEMGLHRSADAWQGTNAEHNPHTIEMRKRIFWSLLSLHISIAGKLGRPMFLRPEDMDIEIPQALPDYLPGEENLSPWRKCSFQVAPHAMKLMGTLSSVYSTIYAVKGSSEPYGVTVQRIEKEVADFRANLPAELAGGPQTQAEDRVFSLYLELIEGEILLTLHHPSLGRNASVQETQRHLDLCLDASNKIFNIAVQMKELNALDSTWYCTTIHLAALFTTLFVHTYRQDQMTSADLQRLRTDMELWLGVMGEVGKMLGSGTRLRDAIRSISDYSLDNIQRHIAAKTASAGLASTVPSSTPIEPAPPQHQQQMLSITNGYYAPADPGNIANSAPSMHPVTNQVGQDHSPAQYQSANHFYPDPQSTNLPQHTPAGMPQYDNTVYNNGADMKPNVEAQLQAELQQHNAPQGQPAPPAFSAFPTQNGYQVTAPQAGPAAWRDFTQGVMTNLPSGSEYAQTLMALQNHAHASKDGTPDMQTTTTMNMAALGGMQMSPQDGGHMQTWPLIHFGPSGGSVGGQ